MLCSIGCASWSINDKITYSADYVSGNPVCSKGNAIINSNADVVYFILSEVYDKYTNNKKFFIEVYTKNYVDSLVLPKPVIFSKKSSI